MKPIFPIPARLAPVLGVNKSAISRWNNGKRKLPSEVAMRVVDLLEAEGEVIDILALKPQLKDLIPYLCRGCDGQQRKLRARSQAKAMRPAG